MAQKSMWLGANMAKRPTVFTLPASFNPLAGMKIVTMIRNDIVAKQIAIVCHADGRLEADLSGFQGTECEKDELLKALKDMLAPESVQETRHPEYYNRQSARVQQRG